MKISIHHKSMENIYETNSKFPFDKLILTPPTVLSGGNYFIKYLVNGSPLYIQPPKCKTKGGIMKSGKRMHCDLMFGNENTDFIQWMEDLETHTCRHIFDNRAKWFESEMDLPDIENYFASPLKSYKSGKYYLARTNINTRLGKISLKIYDENENDVDYETIGENSQIITILEIQGIKCSARSFQIEIEIKQMMVLKPADLFEHCILGKSKSVVTNDLAFSSNISTVKIEETPHIDTSSEEHLTQEFDDTSTSNLENMNENITAQISEKSDVLENLGQNTLENKSNSQKTDLNDFEIDLNLDEVPQTETFQIKARNDVYYEMYKTARQKAKIARSMALAAYLEAKQIKNTYMLDDIEDSTDDEDDTDKGSDKNDMDEYFAQHVN